MRWLKRMMQIYHLVGIFSSARAFTEYVNMITLEKTNFLIFVQFFTLFFGDVAWSSFPLSPSFLTNSFIGSLNFSELLELSSCSEWLIALLSPSEEKSGKL